MSCRRTKNLKGGAHEYSNQIGMIHPGPQQQTTVSGFQYSDLEGSPIASAMATGAGKKRRKRRSRKMRGGMAPLTGMEGVTGLGSKNFADSSPIMAESQKNTIPLETIAPGDWVNQGQKAGPPPYVAEASVGWNEYQFGRTTPDNKFVVATGLVPNKPYTLEMIGAGKKKKTSSKKKKSTSKKSSKKSTAGVVFNKTKEVITRVGDVVIKTVQYVGKKTQNTVGSVTKKMKGKGKK